MDKMQSVSISGIGEDMEHQELSIIPLWSKMVQVLWKTVKKLLIHLNIHTSYYYSAS